MKKRFFNAPDRRRLTAEQIVDSMHAVTGVAHGHWRTDFCSRRTPADQQSPDTRPTGPLLDAGQLEQRTRSSQPELSPKPAPKPMSSRPSAGLDPARSPSPNAITDPNILQPGILANGNAHHNADPRLAQDSRLAQLAVHAHSPASVGRRPLSPHPQPSP